MAPQVPSSLRRSPVETPAFNLAIIFVIILSIVFAALFAVLGSTLYLRLQRKKEQRLNQQRSAQNEPDIAQFEKPELSGDPSVTIHEMDPQRECQELPEQGEGHRHELPEDSVPQELPEDKEGLPHELSGEESFDPKIPTASNVSPTREASQSQKGEHDREKSIKRNYDMGPGKLMTCPRAPSISEEHVTRAQYGRDK
ncbi:hypothetical protein O1611_g1233 [Lasiodiplodia mahajangana]|uniref:Uncharacterized protein n=1 Tax=Lasiodiplodia mahajangana TaxID=1108764 RepID=A0ACC2JY95_9PEZI|nr:hypothetical protein O1611_g1233 [Lasiodiplodia mahajangana]